MIWDNSSTSIDKQKICKYIADSPFNQQWVVCFLLTHKEIIQRQSHLKTTKRDNPLRDCFLKLFRDS